MRGEVCLLAKVISPPSLLSGVNSVSGPVRARPIRFSRSEPYRSGLASLEKKLIRFSRSEPYRSGLAAANLISLVWQRAMDIIGEEAYKVFAKRTL